MLQENGKNCCRIGGTIESGYVPDLNKFCVQVWGIGSQKTVLQKMQKWWKIKLYESGQCQLYNVSETSKEHEEKRLYFYHLGVAVAQ